MINKLTLALTEKAEEIRELIKNLAEKGEVLELLDYDFGEEEEVIVNIPIIYPASKRAGVIRKPLTVEIEVLITDG